MRRTTSQSVTPVVACVPPGGDHRHLLARALGGDIDVTYSPDESGVLAALSRGHGPIVLITLGEQAVPWNASTIASIKSRFPAVRVLGYCGLGPSSSAEILAGARGGMDALVLRGHDDLGRTVRRILTEASGDDTVVLSDLAAMLPQELLEWTRVVLAHAAMGPNVAMLARLVGSTPRTLQRIARRFGFRGPAQVIDATRLLFAARLLSKGSSTTREVLRATGYPSAAALRQSLRRYGLPAPSDIQHARGYARVRAIVSRRLGGEGSGLR